MSEPISMEKAFIRKLTDIILTNISNEHFGVGALAREAGVSRITIHRKIKSITNQDSSQFIREIRLRHAMELLKQNAGNISDIAYMVGFGSPAYFNKCFHEFFGYPPGQVKKERFHKPVETTPDQVMKVHSEKSAPRFYFVILSSVILFFAVLLYGGYILLNKNSYNDDRNLANSSEKSIAVMPFINDSPSDSTTYFINGVMDEILNNLQKISAFSKVISRTSAEQYRGSRKASLPNIAKELNVNYIVEGSGQKYGKIFRLNVRLFDATKDNQIWSHSYEEVFQGTKDIARIQNQVAQTIAAELKTTITPEEIQLIERNPTISLTAYDFYQRGRDEHTKYWVNNNKAALKAAEALYHKALEYDSTFAKAYTGLARVYWDKYFWQAYFSKNFLDSVMVLTKIALSYDHQLSEAYTLKGTYYGENGKLEQAMEEFDIALKLNPNDWMAFRGKGEYYCVADPVNSLYCLQKAISINRGPELPALLREIGGWFFAAGFPTKSKQYYQEALKLDDDSAKYYSILSQDEFWLTNFNKSIELGLKGYAIDSTKNEFLEYLGAAYQWLGYNKESLNYYEKWLNKMKPLGPVAIYGMRRIGYSYWQNGYKKKAGYYLDEQINYSNRMNELSRPHARYLFTYSDLAGVYAFIGEREKAYKNLRIFNQIQRPSFVMLMIIKTDPLFNSIRDEPEFQQIARDIESKYNAEHERVRKWLVANNLL